MLAVLAAQGVSIAASYVCLRKRDSRDGDPRRVGESEEGGKGWDHDLRRPVEVRRRPKVQLPGFPVHTPLAGLIQFLERVLDVETAVSVEAHERMLAAAIIRMNNAPVVVDRGDAENLAAKTSVWAHEVPHLRL